MANFDSDILKEEEKLGGFGLGEPDDDAFSLKSDAYPGEMSRFIDKPEEPKKISEQDDSSNKDSDEIDDPALIGYIQGLQSAMTMKGKKGESDDLPEDTAIRDFEPIDDSNADTHIDISDMDLDKPSVSLAEGKKISLEDINNNDSFEKEEKKSKKKRKNKKEKTENDEEQDKKKIPLFVWLGAAALLLIMMGVGSYFQFFNKNSSEIDLISQDSTEIKTEKITEEKSDTNIIENESKDTTTKEEIKPLDIAELQAEKPQESSTKVSEKIESDVKKDVKKTVKETKAKDIIKKDISELSSAVKPKTENKTQKEKAKAKNTDIASIKPAPKSEIKQKVIEETFTTKKEPQYKFSNIENDVEGVYTVQIYSSPSKKDAEQWLQKLTSRNISDGFISEQKIRDQVWYRVRFGNFNTRSEARTAALRLGFSQTWIDRVK